MSVKPTFTQIVKKGVSLLGLLCVFCVALYFYIIPQSRLSSRVGKRLPDIHFVDSSGASKTVNDFKGKPILIHFWATWCAPCMNEMPTLRVFEQTHPDWVLLAFNLGDERRIDLPADQIPQGLVHDFNALDIQALRVSSIPTTWVVDRELQVRKIIQGERNWASKTTQDTLERFIEP